LFSLKSSDVVEYTVGVGVGVEVGVGVGVGEGVGVGVGVGEGGAEYATIVPVIEPETELPGLSCPTISVIGFPTVICETLGPLLVDRTELT
jgi:hypothetical protein